MRRKFIFSEGEYYHAYSRGVERRDIFLSDADQYRFLKLLYLCNGTRAIEVRTIPDKDTFSYDRGDTLVNVGAYCLMTNHFHLLLREKQNGGTSIFLKKLLTAYSMYFNKKYHRSGVLFEGNFRATHVATDRHLKHLYAYIHLNPISIIEPEWKQKKITSVKNTKEYLRKYPYSSYLDYALTALTEDGPPDNGKESILTKEAFPKYFDPGKEFEDLLYDWIDVDELI